MPKIKLDLKSLSIPEKIDLARQIVKAMTGNPNFPTPTPTLASVTAASDALHTAHEEALAARQESKNKTAVQSQCDADLEDELSRLSNYVASVSGGDEVLITEAGMSIESPASSSGEVGVTTSLNFRAGDSDGELSLKWEAVERAGSYVVQRSLSAPPAAEWMHEATTLKTQHTVKGLTSGTRYWFRVAAVGPNGQGGWSGPATKIAP